MRTSDASLEVLHEFERTGVGQKGVLVEHTRIGGFDIAFSRCGSGDPLVLIHGGEGDQRTYAALVPHLAPYFTVITYDQRDMGASQKATASYEMADLAQEAALLVRSLGYSRAHFLGTSFGGVIGQALALTQPDVVDRLVLGATFPNASAIGSFNPEVAQILQEARTSEPAMRKATALFFSGETLCRRPEVVDQLIELRRETDPESMRRRFEAALRFDAAGRQSEIVMPTLYLTGAEDRIVDPRISWEGSRQAPRSTLVVLSGAGHAWSIDAPDRASAVIRLFLSGDL